MWYIVVVEVYYNDNDPYCCEVLRARIADGSLPKGFVDDRDIRKVRSEELEGYRQIHLFAGIGGFPLGFKWSGMPSDFSIITGGFPCQPVSLAGGRKAQADPRWLWPQFLRLIIAIRPRRVVIENVPGLLTSGGMADVLGGLSAAGYDAEWDCISAADVGAPHLRKRVWIVANAANNGLGWGQQQSQGGEDAGEVADPKCRSGNPRRESIGWEKGPDVDRESAGAKMDNPSRGRYEPSKTELCTRGESIEQSSWWESEPNVDRVAHGIPDRVDRLKGLGNAIVPQIAQWIGQRIMEDKGPDG